MQRASLDRMDSVDSGPMWQLAREQGMLVDNEQERMESKQERLDCAGQWTLSRGGWKVSKGCLKVPKCENFHLTDFFNFFTRKSLWEGDFRAKVKN
jgi:hypothetical protein